eukprot:TRINITY_DN7242_c0_g1_i1.p1 TRINITY_DN7242_c0_g1~~TRINITY_DN7242_c0_g1_i1.p1  ORF type:complete len:312 (+),score=67.06 TRINITY_DN7242_c0_g1_i1:63-938(+)
MESQKEHQGSSQQKRLYIVISLVLLFSFGMGIDGGVNDETVKEMREAVRLLGARMADGKTTSKVKKAQSPNSPTPPSDPPRDDAVIPIGYRPRWRWELGEILQREGKRHGAEIGVQQGEFSAMVLTNWKCASTYMVVDVWETQENYRDIANVDQAGQDHLYETMLTRLDPWKEKLVVMRNWSHDASQRVPDNSLDFVYVDARHDFEAVLEDLRDWWPKLRVGGILSGHDFTSASTVQGFGVQRDGSWDRRAVRGAVGLFSQEVARPYVVIPETKKGSRRKAPFASWMMRKS